MYICWDIFLGRVALPSQSPSSTGNTPPAIGTTGTAKALDRIAHNVMGIVISWARKWYPLVPAASSRRLFLLTPALAALGNLLFFHISEPFIPHPHTLAHHVDATLLLLGAGMGGGVGC